MYSDTKTRKVEKILQNCLKTGTYYINGILFLFSKTQGIPSIILQENCMGSCQVSYLSQSHISLSILLLINLEHPQNLTKWPQRYKFTLRYTEVIILNEPWLLYTPESLFTSPISVSPANLVAIWHFFQSSDIKIKQKWIKKIFCNIQQSSWYYWFIQLKNLHIFFYIVNYFHAGLPFPPNLLISFLHFYSLAYYKEPSSYFLCKGKFFEQLN